MTSSSTFPATLDTFNVAIDGAKTLADASQKHSEIHSWIGDALNKIEAAFTSEAWIAPTLEGAWVNYGGTPTVSTAGYYKDSTNRVHIRGYIKNTADSGMVVGTLFTLPVGYRIDVPEHRAVLTATGMANLTIDTTGGIYAPGGSAGTSGTWTCLDGISFRAA